jgi:hypothetical protein
VRPKAVFVESDISQLNAQVLKVPIPSYNLVGRTKNALEEGTTHSVTWMFPPKNEWHRRSFWEWVRGKKIQRPSMFYVQTIRYSSADSFPIPAVGKGQGNGQRPSIIYLQTIRYSSADSFPIPVVGKSQGNEFDNAIREGQKIGATIVLGDAFVSLTKLIRLSIFSSFQLGFHVGYHGLRKDKIRNAPETRKTLQGQLTHLKQVCPGFFRYAVTERDEYMANGLDRLPQFETVVAVMGKEHLDGVEERLKTFGWKPVVRRSKVFKVWMRWHYFVQWWQLWNKPGRC